MRIFQVALIGFPDRRAASLQIARMAAAYEAIGSETTLVHQWTRSAVPWSDVAREYGLEQLPRRLLLPGSRLAAWSPVRSLHRPIVRASLLALAARARPDDVFVGRHPHDGLMRALIGARARGQTRAAIVVEIHEARHFVAEADAHIDGYVAISHALAAALTAAGIDRSRICVAPNGVDVPRYRELRAGRQAQRRQLGLRDDRKYVCYTGQLFGGRNTAAIIGALRHLGTEFEAILVGGSDPDIERLQSKAIRAGVHDRVRFTGHQTGDVAARYQCASDVVVIPYHHGSQTAAWCSPLKAGEYLASGTPIAAFPLPALQEIYQPGEVEWAMDYTSAALAQAIAAAARRAPTPDGAQRLQELSWTARATRIAAFVTARLVCARGADTVERSKGGANAGGVATAG